MKKSKLYWEMNTAELREATKQFDDPAYQPSALKSSVKDVSQQRSARSKGGRTSTSLGAERTVEQALLARSDSKARA